MSPFRRTAVALFASLLSLALGASPPPPNTAWEKMKSLAGDWTGSYVDGSPVKVSYRLVSGGTALMETMNMHDSHEMVTVYHPDGDRLLMTHYCSEATQPRMRASALSSDGKRLEFDFLDATNAGPDALVMRRLVVTFGDADHITQNWTSRLKGKEQTGTFQLARAK
jgi:hypothetical protein